MVHGQNGFIVMIFAIHREEYYHQRVFLTVFHYYRLHFKTKLSTPL